MINCPVLLLWVRLSFIILFYLIRGLLSHNDRFDSRMISRTTMKSMAWLLRLTAVRSILGWVNGIIFSVTNQSCPYLAGEGGFPCTAGFSCCDNMDLSSLQPEGCESSEYPILRHNIWNNEIMPLLLYSCSPESVTSLQIDH